MTFAFILGTFVGTALVVHLGINLINKDHHKADKINVDVVADRKTFYN